MSDPLTVTAGERGVVRVFGLSVEAGGAKALQAPGATAAALGVGPLDMDHVDVFSASDLEGVGLTDFLIEGIGIPKEDLKPDRAKLDTVTGLVIVVRSRAFGGEAVALRPAGQMRLIGCYREPGVDWRAGAPLTSASARPSSGRGRSPRRHRVRTRWIGGSVFGVFVAVVLAIILLVVL